MTTEMNFRERVEKLRQLDEVFYVRYKSKVNGEFRYLNYDVAERQYFFNDYVESEHYITKFTKREIRVNLPCWVYELVDDGILEISSIDEVEGN